MTKPAEAPTSQDGFRWDEQMGVPRFGYCKATRRLARVLAGRPIFTRDELWSLGCYLEAALRRERESFGLQPRKNRLIRKLTYYWRKGMPKVEAVKR
jgi:hypothetical protein